MEATKIIDAGQKQENLLVKYLYKVLNAEPSHVLTSQNAPDLKVLAQEWMRSEEDYLIQKDQLIAIRVSTNHQKYQTRSGRVLSDAHH